MPATRAELDEGALQARDGDLTLAAAVARVSGDADSVHDGCRSDQAKSSPPIARPGAIALAVAARAASRAARACTRHGSLRVRFPNAAASALEAVIVNTGGGMTGGDRFAVDIDGRRRAPG